ncbi:MAG: hypothetical protein ABIK28_18890, partial [Planctomycetota bacterium]
MASEITRLKAELAQVLARAGLHHGVPTVKRMLKEEPTVDIEDAYPLLQEEHKIRLVIAKYPDHVWH